MKTVKVSRTASAGIAIAPAFVVGGAKTEATRRHIADIEGELRRFDKAVEKVKGDLAELAGKEEIFAAHLELVQDPSLCEEVYAGIREQAKDAEWAVEETIEAFASLFEQMEDAYMRERKADVCDIGKRLLCALQGIELSTLKGMRERAIVIAGNLMPSDTACMETELVAGFITQEGGITSHVSIMANNLGLPALVGVGDILHMVRSGDLVAMDAGEGTVVINPDAATLALYMQKEQERAQWMTKCKSLAALPALSADGKPIKMYANVGSVAEIERALELGAEGVGLFRTEFLYMERSEFPEEEVQYQIYRDAALSMKGRELIIRTLDIGGDKGLPYFDFGEEENPFLGYRAIRVCLDRQDIFKTQLRALLRAAYHGDIRIMFPMIVSMEEWKRAQALLQACKQELSAEGKAYREDIPVGMMIETPASVFCAGHFAKQVDFFSIGTNDLTQYTLAVDRGNKRIASMYDPFEPAVLAAISQVVAAGHAAGKPVGMCGEFAGNPEALELLLGLGLDELSMAAPMIPEMKAALQKIDSGAATRLSARVLTAQTKGEIRELLGAQG